MIGPDWFFGYDVALELLFAIITMIVAIQGFRIYKATLQKQPLYLAWSFLLISISNIIQSIINFLIITELNENVSQIVKIESITLFNNIGIYTHMFFMIVGLSILTFMTLKTKEIRGLILIPILALTGTFLSINPFYFYNVITSILLITITWYYINNYLKNKKTNTLMIAIAFLFLLFGSIHFLFAVNHSLFYAIGNILELVAFSLVLVNFVRVRKR